MKALVLNRSLAAPGVAECLAQRLTSCLKPGAIILLHPDEFKLLQAGMWIECGDPVRKPDEKVQPLHPADEPNAIPEFIQSRAQREATFGFNEFHIHRGGR